MAFPESIIYAYELSPKITSQNIDDVLNIIEKECRNHGDLKFIHENDKLIFESESFLFGSEFEENNYNLFQMIERGTVHIDSNSHGITYTFYVSGPLMFCLVIVIASLLVFSISKDALSYYPIIVIVIIALCIGVTAFFLEKFAIKTTDKINEAFEKAEEVEEA